MLSGFHLQSMGHTYSGGGQKERESNLCKQCAARLCSGELGQDNSDSQHPANGARRAGSHLELCAESQEGNKNIVTPEQQRGISLEMARAPEIETTPLP